METSGGRTAGRSMPSRRQFLKAAGTTGLLAGAGSVLSACAGWTNSSSSASGSSQTITVTGISSFGIMKPLISDFTKQTGINVNLRILAYDQLRQASIADFTAKSKNSDVYTQDIVWLGEWATKKYSRPLDDLIERDKSSLDVADILPGAINSLSKWDNATWSMPWGAYYFLTFFRQDLFQAAGFPAPQTLADYQRILPALTDAAKNQYGIAMPYQAGAPIADWFLATLVGAGGKVIADPPGSFAPQLDTPVAAEVFNEYLSWLKYSPPGAANFNWNDSTNAMQTGQAAVAASMSVNAALMNDPQKSHAAGHVGYTYTPRMSAADTPVAPFGGWALAINADSQNVEPSWKFLKWAASADVQRKAALLTGTPVRRSVLQDPAARKQYPWLALVEEAESKGYVQPNYRPRYPFWPQMEQAVGKQLNLAAIGQKTAAAALADANSQSKAIIQAAGYPVG